MRRILTARQQAEMLAPWRLAYDIQSPAPGEPLQTKRGPKVPSTDPDNDPMGHLDKRPYDYNTMVDNLVSHYNGASDKERKQGRLWYRVAHDMFHKFAKDNNTTPERAVAMGAAFSPLTDWGDNVYHAEDFMLGYRPGEPGFSPHDWQIAHVDPKALDSYRQQYGRDPSTSHEDLNALADLHGDAFKRGPKLNATNDLSNPEARANWMENIQHHGMDTILADSAGQAAANKKKANWRPAHAMRASGINTLGSNIQKAKDLHAAPDDIVQMFKVLGGPKISHFTDNILDDTPIDSEGYYQHPNGDWTQNKDLGGTIDSHHVRAASMAHGQWERKPYAAKNPSTVHEYDVFNRGLLEATRRVNAMEKDPTKHITPKQLQAIVWLKHKNDKDFFERQRNPLTGKPIKHESELDGNIEGRADWQYTPKDYKSRGRERAASLDEEDFAEMPPLWRKMFMSRQPQEWTDLLAAWVEHHSPDTPPDLPFDRNIQASRDVAAWVDQIITAGNGFDNPWEGPDAESLRKDCPYCDAPGFDMHQVDCPTLYTDTPEIDHRMLGPKKDRYQVPVGEYPQFRLNSILSYVDRLLGDR